MAVTDLTRPAPIAHPLELPTLVYSGPPLTNMALRHELGGAWNGGHIYVTRDAEALAIYVGMSVNVPSRLDKHRRRDWWRAVTTVDIYFVPRPSGENARQFAARLRCFELSAIQHLHPIENIAGVA